tara:strand:- start:343 stop:630 length:288 start_codon:yes stop_codon:yes gene_type:complete
MVIKQLMKTLLTLFVLLFSSSVVADESSPITLTIWELIGIFLFIGLYFLPCYIASHRNHHQTKTIFLLNLFLGWTGIGFLGLIFYASLSKVEKLD